MNRTVLLLAVIVGMLLGAFGEWFYLDYRQRQAQLWEREQMDKAHQKALEEQKDASKAIHKFRF